MVEPFALLVRLVFITFLLCFRYFIVSVTDICLFFNQWYCQVVRAKKKDTGIVYALKIMDKKFITKENKTAYVKLERIVLDQLDHPGIVRLFFTFQDTFSLCRYFWPKNLCHVWLFMPNWVFVIWHSTFDYFVKTWHSSPVKVENFLTK